MRLCVCGGRAESEYHSDKKEINSTYSACIRYNGGTLLMESISNPLFLLDLGQNELSWEVMERRQESGSGIT